MEFAYAGPFWDYRTPKREIVGQGKIGEAHVTDNSCIYCCYVIN